MRELVASLERTDLSKIDTMDLELRIRKLLTGHRRWVSDCIVGQEIYRARKTDENITNISQIAAREHVHCSEFQRASYPGRSMFYASANFGSVLNEIDISVGDTILLSKWRTKFEFPVNSIGFNKKLLQKNEIEKNDTAFQFGLPKGVVNEPAFRLVDNFIANQFTRKISSASDYKISATIANALMDYEDKICDERKKSIQAIIYPSLASRSTACNIAVRKGLADSVFELVALQKFYVEGLASEQHYVLIFKGAATVENGQIVGWDTGKPVERILPEATKSIEISPGNWKRKDEKIVAVSDLIHTNNDSNHR